MKKSHDLVATIGSYTNSSGEEKKRYQKCGAVFTSDDGRMSVKLDAVPLGPEWSGWFSLYDAELNQGQVAQQAQPAPF